MGNFGLTNPYLKFGVVLLLLGAAVLAVPFVFETRESLTVYSGLGLTLFLAGAVIYTGGRIAKAVRGLSGRVPGDSKG
ncbi:hypothetical protein [Novilysobacter defluvii]|uniref:Uncharacterized protein n=1 Tax=Lysobacter defluvii IMMIB APB-9 = DSM 18482 TaxID=1385515 RepID=A0A0A0MAL6_9GAMM|nr:hypothetical protein [Lysobacter defluvii]KGO99172.1 hypothetical protein N791_10940 [Lysobacter defluvii IMMIB APB-9 = DSM 18482]